MRTFKQHLNALEKQRKLEKLKSPNDGVMPVYVHGKHAATPTDNSFPNYVHGRHASDKLNEKTRDDHIIDFGDNVVDAEFEPLYDPPLSNKPARRDSTNRGEPTKAGDWFNYYNNNANDGKGIDSLDNELTSHYHDHLESHPDLDHVYQYTKGSGTLNRALIRAHQEGSGDELPGLGREMGERYTKRKEGIDRVLSSKPAPKDFDTFSGLGFDPRRYMDENGVMHSPAYLSSSINPQIAHSFATTISSETGQQLDYDEPLNKGERHILRIPVNQFQTNGAYVNSISNFGPKYSGGGAGEQEFLHKRGQKFKIDPTPQTLTGYDGAKVHIWSAVPQED